jgi:hypothetical protein
LQFFNTYRHLQSVETFLRNIAGQFQNRVKNRSESSGAPILEAPQRTARRLRRSLLSKNKTRPSRRYPEAREPARILIAIGNKKDNRWHLQIVADYALKKAIDHVPQLHQKLSSIVDNYLNIQQDILETFLDRGQLRNLSQPTILPNGQRQRIPGLNLDHPRQLAADPYACFGALSHIAAGNSLPRPNYTRRPLRLWVAPHRTTVFPRCVTICQSSEPRAWSRNSHTPGDLERLVRPVAQD